MSAVVPVTASERCLGFSTFCVSSTDTLLHRAGTAAAAAAPAPDAIANGSAAAGSANASASGSSSDASSGSSGGGGVGGSDGQTVNSRFYQLKQLTAKHSALCQYVDIHRGLRDRIFIVSEHFTLGVNDIRVSVLRDLRWCRQLLYEAVTGVAFLHSLGIVHRNLTLAAIRITPQGHAKLCDYGVYTMTDRGRAVPFAIALPSHLPPELLLSGPHPAGSASLAHNLKADVWSFGVCLFELLFSTPYSQSLATAAVAAGSAAKSKAGAGAAAASNPVWTYIRHMLSVLELVQFELSEYDRTRREQKRARRAAFDADLKSIQSERERATAHAAACKLFNTANPKLAPAACTRCRAALPRPKTAPAATAGGSASGSAAGLQQPANARAVSTGKRPVPPTAGGAGGATVPAAGAAAGASAVPAPVAPAGGELCAKCQSDDRTSRDRSERERSERWNVDRAFERERHRLRSTDVRTCAALIQLIRSCLSVSTADRPSAADLLKHTFFAEVNAPNAGAAAGADKDGAVAAAPQSAGAANGPIQRVVPLPVPVPGDASSTAVVSASGSAPDLVIEKYLICSRCRLLETACACTTPDEVWLQIKSSNAAPSGTATVSIRANAATAAAAQAAAATNAGATATPATPASATSAAGLSSPVSSVMTPVASNSGVDRKHSTAVPSSSGGGSGSGTPRGTTASTASSAVPAASAAVASGPALSLCCEWSITDVYYLWRTIGGSVEAELARAGRLDSAPPIMRLPPYVSVNAFPHRSNAAAAAATPAKKSQVLELKSGGGDEKKSADDATAVVIAAAPASIAPPLIDQTYESLPEKYSPVILPIPVRWINHMIANEMEREMKGYAVPPPAALTPAAVTAAATPSAAAAASIASPTPTAATAPPTPTADTSTPRVDTKTPPLRLEEKTAQPIAKKGGVPAPTSGGGGGGGSARGRVGSNATRRKPNDRDRDAGDTASEDGTASVVSSSAASDAGAGDRDAAVAAATAGTTASIAGASGAAGADAAGTAAERAAASERAAAAAAIASLGITAKNRDEEEAFRASIRRIHAFRHLLKHYPATRLAIIELARREGVPAQLRRELWPVILGVETGDLQSIYDRHVSAATAAAAAAATAGRSHSGDLHQLDVDIPRCHQYHDLINSRPAHAKMRRILRAWLISNPNQHSYWQGLDSVLAPFLVMFFDNEAMAFACLQKVYDSYLKSFLMPNNSVMLDRHMSLFCQLLSYEDPELALHLQKIGFHPSMYAIPWVFTLFSHILPLHQIALLWDTIFLQLESGVPIRRARKPAPAAAAAAAPASSAAPSAGGAGSQPAASAAAQPESNKPAAGADVLTAPLPSGVIPPFPLFMAVAILRWLRTRLLTLDLSGCLMYFSNLTALNLHRCIVHALHSYRSTPHSFVSSHVHYDVLIRQQKQAAAAAAAAAAQATSGAAATKARANGATDSGSDDSDESGDDSDTEKAVAASLAPAAAAGGEHKRGVSGDAPPAAAAAAVVADERKAANERARSAQQKERIAREQQMVCAPVLSIDNLIEMLRDTHKRNTVWVVDIRSAADFTRCHFGYAATIPYTVSAPAPIAASAPAAGGGSKPDAAGKAGVSGTAPIGSAAAAALAKGSKPAVVPLAAADKKAGGAAAALVSGSGVATPASGGLQWLDRAGAIAEHVRSARGVFVVVGNDEEHEQRFALEVMRERFAVHVCVLQRGMRAVLERVHAASRVPNATPLSVLSDLLVIPAPPPSASASVAGVASPPVGLSAAAAGSTRRLV